MPSCRLHNRLLTADIVHRATGGVVGTGRDRGRRSSPHGHTIPVRFAPPAVQNGPIPYGDTTLRRRRHLQQHAAESRWGECERRRKVARRDRIIPAELGNALLARSRSRRRGRRVLRTAACVTLCCDRAATAPRNERLGQLEKHWGPRSKYLWVADFMPAGRIGYPAVRLTISRAISVISSAPFEPTEPDGRDNDPQARRIFPDEMRRIVTVSGVTRFIANSRYRLFRRIGPVKFEARGHIRDGRGVRYFSYGAS